MLTTTPKSSGFTLIEVLITVTILAISVALGVPSYRAWIQNTQIRNAAESIQNGIQRTRAEAVKRNANIEFVLGANPPWIIKIAGVGGAEIERASREGAKNVTVTATPPGATTITFSNFGAVATNTPASATLTQVDLDSTVLVAADSRNLRVMLNTGGSVRMCDPNLPAGSSPRAC